MYLVIHIDPSLLPTTHKAGQRRICAAGLHGISGGLCSQAVPRRLPCESRDSIQNVKGFITELYGVPFLRQNLYFNGVLLHDDGITLDSLGIDDEDELAVRPKRRQGALLRGAAAASRAARSGSWSTGEARGSFEAQKVLQLPGGDVAFQVPGRPSNMSLTMCCDGPVLRNWALRMQSLFLDGRADACAVTASIALVRINCCAVLAGLQRTFS
ncbi:unnamed protein product [Symbiodinium necroappetens]|uniref:Ubiquitin-like domain-containing protein n=1 Tax=Symbiodinium necroappetens TaxID=1628268 RepID=A0A812J1S0_9DINO|nr:unnamed protein product [Symbiodinium necroappetens]